MACMIPDTPPEAGPGRKAEKALYEALAAARQGAILHTTIGKFKGLESDILFFADVDPEDARCGSNARYVAVSGTRQVLHEFWKRPW